MRRPRPWLAFVLSIPAPGLGHLYADGYAKALMALLIAIAIYAMGAWMVFRPLGTLAILAAAALFVNGEALPREAAGSAEDSGRVLDLFSESLGDRSYRIADDPHRERLAHPEVTVPPGRYWVMGDNRDYSKDSRLWGTVRRAEIVGKVTHLYFSRDPKTGSIDWGRIGLRVE